MNEQPQPTRFSPVAALPIVVLSHGKDECKVLIAGEVFAGGTMREAVDAAMKEKSK